MTNAIISINPAANFRVKAAEDSPTPRRWRVFPHPVPSARLWSAAVLCRFVAIEVRDFCGSRGRSPHRV